METSNEESVAKGRGIETRNDEQIIQELRMDLQEQRRVNQNLRDQLAMNYKRIQELEQKKKLDNEKFALFFETQGHQHIAENIFLHMDFEDLVALQNKKSGCELINQRCYDILKNPNFWLKKWTMNGLTEADKVEWMKILEMAKTTNQEEDVLRYIKKVIQQGHFVSVPCYIVEEDLERFLNLPKTPDQVNLAMDNNELGIVQLMAPPLMKSPNALNRNGRTPIGSNKAKIVKILAPLMVNPNAPKVCGWTPIDAAAYRGNLDIIEVLAPLTENPNALNQDGWTPIDEAASRGNLDIIEVLAPLTENPNAPDQDGRTPIHEAAEGGHVNVIRFLAPLTENPNVPDTNDGRTPIYWATLNGHQDVVDELNRYVHANE